VTDVLPDPGAAVQSAALGEPAPDRALKAYALALLAQREYSRAELRRKLLVRDHAGSDGPRRANSGNMRRERREPTAADTALLAEGLSGAGAAQRVEAALDWLEAHRHLSDQRFVESRIRVRCERFGNLRIRHELAQHGLALPAEAEAALIESEFERARAIWERRFGTGTSIATDAAKQARFLTGRGFSADVIRRVLRGTRSVLAGSDSPASAPDATFAPDARATLPR
jgi:regulatory protein